MYRFEDWRVKQAFPPKGVGGLDLRLDTRRFGPASEFGSVSSLQARRVGMYISAKLDYAVRALLVTAAKGDGVTAASIAAIEGVSVPYMAFTLRELSRAGLLERAEVRGYRLSRPTTSVRLAEVFSAIGDPVLEVHEHLPATSRSEAYTKARPFWEMMRLKLLDLLERTTLHDLEQGSLDRLIDQS